LLLHTDLEFPKEQILNCKNLGLSSGASAPEILIQNLIKKIKKIRNVQIEEVTSATENVTFKIPSTLQ
jgi:4-hydroxy-3-methylbut-2-en-1-yl diphosphate reductase